MTRTPPVMTQSLPIEGQQNQGVAASPPLSHPSGAEPVPVSGKAGIANAGHTPGPWRYENRHTHCAIYHTRAPQDGYANRVAETMQWSPAAAGRVTPTEAEANARLIAAAPLLLEALEKIVVQTDASANPISRMVNSIASEAIAAARGGQ